MAIYVCLIDGEVHFIDKKVVFKGHQLAGFKQAMVCKH